MDARVVVVPEFFTHPVASPPVKVADLPKGLIPTRYFEPMEQDQLLPHCCRHPENHFIMSFYSPKGKEERTPDIYIFVCDQCGGKHRRFCAGGGDIRPMWTVR